MLDWNRLDGWLRGVDSIRRELGFLLEPPSVELLPTLARQFDEPIADSSILQARLARNAAEPEQRAQAELLARQAAAHLEGFGERAKLLQMLASFVVTRRN